MSLKNKSTTIFFGLIIYLLAFHCLSIYGYSSKIEQDRILVTEKPKEAYKIADEWFESGNFEFALEFDNLFLKEYPIMASRVADKWFDRGNIELALEFDNLSLKESPFLASEVADKWFDRGHVEFARTIYSSNFSPFFAFYVFNNWLKVGQFEKAEKFANRILEIWVSEDDEKINQGLLWKLAIAAKINSEFYYEKLKSKEDPLKEKDHSGLNVEEIYHYSKALKNIALKSDDQCLSIADYLANKFYVDPDLINQDMLTKEKLNKIIQFSLYELNNKSDITFSIMHGIALHAKENPYFRINVFKEHTVNDELVGSYNEILDRTQIAIPPPVLHEIFGWIIIHEWCHQLMNVLYNNHCKPYQAGNKEAQSEYWKAIEAVQKAIVQRKLFSSVWSLFFKNAEQKVIERFQDLIDFYEESKYEQEYIVKLPEIIAQGHYDDSVVQEILKPLYDYWMKYIAPDIEKYIKDRALISDFISMGNEKGLIWRSQDQDLK